MRANRQAARSKVSCADARFCASSEPDLVHSHCFHANIFARLLRFFGPKFVVLSTVHNVYEGGWGRMMAYRLTDFLSSRTVAVSQAAADRFMRLKAIPRAKMHGHFEWNRCRRICSHRRGEGKKCAPRWGSRPGAATFIWLAVGRLAPAKDYPNMLPAFAAAVRAEKSAAQLWVAGDARGDRETAARDTRERFRNRRRCSLARLAPRHARIAGRGRRICF